MLSLLLTFFLSIGSDGSALDPCKVYGKIYEVDNAGLADYIVYIEDSEAFADLLVFEHENPLYADRPGQWAFVENRSFANVYIYFETRKSRADFSIAFIETESFAGCNR